MLIVLPMLATSFIFSNALIQNNQNKYTQQINTQNGVEVINEDITLSIRGTDYNANLSISLSTYVTGVGNSSDSYQINSYIDMEDSYTYQVQDEKYFSLQYSLESYETNENILSFAEDTSTLTYYSHVSGTNDFEISKSYGTNNENGSNIIPKSYSAVTFILYNDKDGYGISGDDEYYIFEPIFLAAYDSTITPEMKPLYYSNFRVEYTDPELVLYFNVNFSSINNKNKYKNSSITGQKEFYASYTIEAKDLDNPERPTAYFVETGSFDTSTNINIDVSSNNNVQDNVKVTIDLSKMEYYSRIYYDSNTKKIVSTIYPDGGDISTNGDGIYLNDVLDYNSTQINTMHFTRYVSDSDGNVDSNYFYKVVLISEEEYYASISQFVNEEPNSNESYWWIILLSLLIGTVGITTIYSIYRKLVIPKDDFIPNIKDKTNDDDPDLILGRKQRKN